MQSNPMALALNSSAAYLLLTGLMAPLPLSAADFKIGNADASVTGLVTFGTAIRADTEDAFLINRANAAAIGIIGVAPGGANSDDGNLNYRRGDVVSTVLKGFVDFAIKQDKLGALLRVKAWHDFTLDDGDVPWGHTPNGITGGQPLSDAGFRHRAKFSGVALQDAYIYNTFSVADRPLYVNAGNQVIPWGGRVTIAGGLGALKPFDGPAAVRPGAAPEETWVPVPAVFGRLGVTERLNVEGYYQILFRPGDIPGCGTFFSTTDYTPVGCEQVVTGAVPGVSAPNDRQRLAAGAFLKRSPTPDASDSGLYGVGTTYKIGADTEVGAYFARYNNPIFLLTNATKTTRLIGAPFITGDPGGQNPTYFTEYAEGVRVFALNLESKFERWIAYGQVSYRPNQPVSLNAGDLLAAITSNTAPTPLRAQINALPPGGVLRGFDRLKAGQAQVGIVGQLPGLLGAAILSLGGEVGLKHVFDLPDVNVRRYGRADVFGNGPVNGICSSGGSPDLEKQCSTDGYVTKNAWGYRLSASLLYSNVLPNVDLTPRAVFGHDVKGWAYDGVFNEGRQALTLTLPAAYRKAYSATIAYTTYWGGSYSTIKDRDFLSLSIGARF